MDCEVKTEEQYIKAVVEICLTCPYERCSGSNFCQRYRHIRNQLIREWKRGAKDEIDKWMIVNAFYCCKVKDRCSIDCPYWDGKSTFNECMKRLYDDVYSLLKEQERLIEEAEERGFQRGQKNMLEAEASWKGK